MDVYRVTAPYVIAKTVTSEGVRVKGLNEGAVVPGDVSEDWLAHHLRKNMIEKVGGAARPAPVSVPVQADPVVAQPRVSEPAQGSGPAVPPESGPGSGKGAWVDYAVASGMNRDEAAAMPRDDLIAALKEA